MRGQLRLAAAFFLLLTAQPGQAGPLNWAGRNLPRGDPSSVGDSNPPTAAPSAGPSTHSGSDGAPAATPRPVYETLTGSSVVIPSSLLSVSNVVEPSSTQASTKVTLALTPLDGKGSTSAETATAPSSALLSAVPSSATPSYTAPASAGSTTASSRTGGASSEQPADSQPASSAPSAPTGHTELSSLASTGPLTEVAPSTGAQSTLAGSGTATNRRTLARPLLNTTGIAPTNSAAPHTTGLPEASSKPAVATTDAVPQTLASSGTGAFPTLVPTAIIPTGGSSAGTGQPSEASSTTATAGTPTTTADSSAAVVNPTSPKTRTGGPIGVAPPASTGTLGTGTDHSTGGQTTVPTTTVPQTTVPQTTIPQTSINPSVLLSTGVPTVVLPPQTSEKPTFTSPTSIAPVPPPAPSSPASSADTSLPLLPPSSSASAAPDSTAQPQRPATSLTVHLPMAITSLPTATASVSADVYASNLAQAKTLNELYATLTPQSACSGSQAACINGQIARCAGGAFQLDACPVDQKCLVFPMTNAPGVSIACRDPKDAKKVLGDGAGDGGSSAPASTPAAPTTTKPARPVVTMTTVVTVVDPPTTDAAPPPSYAPGTIAPLPESPSSAQPNLPSPPAPFPTPSPSTPTTAPAKGPPRKTASGGGQIVITESIRPPGATPPATSQAAQEPSSTNYAGTPTPNRTSLMLFPLDKPSAQTDAASPTAVVSDKANGNGGSGGGNKAGGAARTTEVVNGTPTVSVYFTVTVTERPPRETQTVTLIVPSG